MVFDDKNNIRDKINDYDDTGNTDNKDDANNTSDSNCSGSSIISVLYDRPEYLATKPGMYSRYSFYNKILRFPYETFGTMDNDKIIEPLEEFLKTNPAKLLACITQMGGAIKEQLNYLGLFSIAELNGNSSLATSRIAQINKKSNDGKMLETKKYNCNDFHISLTEPTNAAYKFLDDCINSCRDIGITSNLYNSEHKIFRISDTHDANIEHAAGYCDLYAYILGNEYYPPNFKFINEDVLYYGDDNRVIADAHVTTYSVLHVNIEKNGKIICQATYTAQHDFIETDTGSQRINVIAEKLDNYLKYLDSVENIPEVFFSVNFITHPTGICGYVKKDAEKAKKRISGIRYAEALFFKEVLVNGGYKNIEELYNDIKENGITQIDFPQKSELVKNGCSTVTHEFLETLENCIVSGYGSDDFKNLLNDIGAAGVSGRNGEPLTFYNQRYSSYCEQYDKRKRTIFGVVNYLQKNRPKVYEKLIRYCLNGFSVNVSMGGDMYRTYFSVHPKFSGCADATAAMLYRCSLSNTYVQDMYLLNMQRLIYRRGDGTTGVLLNHIAYRDVDPDDEAVLNYGFVKGDGLNYCHNGFCIEDIDCNIGSRIRVKKALSDTSLISSHTRLCIICDSVESAYEYMVKECSDILMKHDSLSCTGCLPDGHRDAFLAFMPVFIPRDVLFDILAKKEPENAPFVFRGYSIYKDAVVSYSQSGTKKSFEKFFSDFLRKSNLAADVFSIEVKSDDVDSDDYF